MPSDDRWAGMSGDVRTALVNDRLLIPYGCTDQSICFATIPVRDLLHLMRPAS